MDLTRRRFLSAAVAAPFVITTPGLLMPVLDFWKPRLWTGTIGRVDGFTFLPEIWSPLMMEHLCDRAVLGLMAKIDEDVMRSNGWTDRLQIGRVPGT